MVWLTDEKCLAIFPVGTTVRDPYQRQFPTRREQGLNLRRTWGCAVAITTTLPRSYKTTTSLQNIAIDAFNFCSAYIIKLTPHWIPRKQNQLADHYSRTT